MKRWDMDAERPQESNDGRDLDGQGIDLHLNEILLKY
jgi:hypothetical protein